MNSDTPLSDAMVELVNDSDNYLPQFREIFLAAEIGIHVSHANITVNERETFQTTEEHQIEISSVDDGKGNDVIVAFADPPVFVRNFHDKFLDEFGLECNASLPGADLIRTVLFNPDSRGIRLNSATMNGSVILDLETLQSIVKGAQSD